MMFRSGPPVAMACNSMPMATFSCLPAPASFFSMARCRKVLSDPVPLVLTGGGGDIFEDDVGCSGEEALCGQYALAADVDADDGIEHGIEQVPESVPVETDDDKLMKLVSTQSFDGAFKLTEILANLLNTTLEDMQNGTTSLIKCQCHLLDFFSIFQTTVDGSAHSENVWATLLSLAYMKLSLASLEDSWMLVASKAERWLRTVNCSDVLSAKQNAETFVKRKLQL